MNNQTFPTKMSVEKFKYNGFFVQSKNGVYADYEIVKLSEWTMDGGIGKFLCTDGEERLIPTCQLSPEYAKELYETNPQPDRSAFKGKGVLFGQPSQS